MSDVKPALRWREVVGYEGIYDVSETGMIRRRAIPDSIGRPRRMRVLKPCDDGEGYMRVSLCRDAEPTVHRVHRVVARAFHGPPPSGAVVNHIDGDKANNAADNLEWVTHQENDEHAMTHGLKARGEGHGMVTLSKQEVYEIRRRARRGETYRSIAGDVPVTEQQVSKVARGLSWSHV